jgi:TP901 family phage tail tape measure protein
MSDLNIRSTLIGVDKVSPVITKLLANIRKLQAEAIRLNSSFASAGRSGTDAFASFDLVAKNAAAQMRGFANSSQSTARSYVSDWKRADDQRLREARSMYSQLQRMEESYQRNTSRQPVRHHANRSGAAGGSGGGRGGFLMFPGTYGMIAGGTAAAGVKSAFEQRMKADAAEVKAKIFGELSKQEIKGARKSWIDRDAVKYGIAPRELIDSYTEALKSGFGKDGARQITDGALKAQSALDFDATALTKLAGKVATIFGGDIKNVDPSRVVRMLNSIGVAAAETAADPNEVVEAFKKGNAALAMSRMSEGDLAAILSVGISAGIQPAKAGNAISNLVSTLVGGRSATGQKAKDLNETARMLGFGSRQALADQAAANPTATLIEMFKRINKLSEQNRTKVAKLLGGSEWDDEIIQLSKPVDSIVATIEATRKKVDLLDRASADKLNSLQGRWNSVSAAFVLHFEKIGEGLEGSFRELSDWFLEHSARIDNDRLASNARKLADTIKQKLQPVVSLLETFGTIFSRLSDAITKLDEVFGGTIVDKSLKKMQEYAVRAMPPMLLLPPTVSKIIADVIVGVLRQALEFFVNKKPDDGTPRLERQSFLDISKKAGQEFRKAAFLSNAADDFRKNIVLASYKCNSAIPASFGGGSRSSSIGGVPGLMTNLPGTSLPGSILGSGGIIKRSNMPSFSGTGGSLADGLSRSAFEKKFAGTPMAGQYDAVVATAKANGVPSELLAGIIAHETGAGVVLSGNNPGGLMDSKTGSSRKMRFGSLADGIAATGRTVGKRYREAGGNLDAMGQRYAPPGAANDPRGLNGGWPAGVRRHMRQLSTGVGSAGTGDAVGYAEKFLGMNEYRDVRVLAASFGGDVRGKSNAWCARFVNKSIEQAGGKGTGSAVANSFQRYGVAVKPSDVKRNDVLLETGGKGYNQTGGHVGLATGETRTLKGRLQMRMISGNDADGVRYRWVNADDPRLMVRRGNSGLTGNVPQGMISEVPPASMIQNVPPPPPQAGPGAQFAGMSAGGPVAIHIHGSSHDPEALATLVQRRVDESMNWRTHDTASEYT